MTRPDAATLPAPSSSHRCDNSNPNFTELLRADTQNAQHHAHLLVDAQHTPLSPSLGSGDAGETDEGNYPRKHGCGDAQLENKCSQSGIQSPTHRSVSEIKRTGHIQQKCALLWDFLPKPVTEKHGTGHLALHTNRTSQPSVSPKPVSFRVCHSPQGCTSTQCSVFGFTWSVQTFFSYLPLTKVSGNKQHQAPPESSIQAGAQGMGHTQLLQAPTFHCSERARWMKVA